jgi:predicted MFS family arabinose efflux permease
MLFGLLLFIAGTSVVIIWPTYPVFMLALILTLLGKYVFDPSMQAYLGDQVPYQRRGRVLAVTELGWSLSFIIGVPLMGFLIARGGWVQPYFLLSILGVVSFFGLFWLLPKEQQPAGVNSSFWDNIQKVLTFPPALAGLSLGLLTSAGNEIVNLVFGVWMEDAFGLQVIALGLTAAVIGFAELGGETFSIGLTDRLGKPRSIGLGILLNCLTALLLPILGRNLPGALIGLFLFFLTFEFTLVSTIPMMTEILPSARATLMATNVASVSLGRALGAYFAPHLYDIGISSSALATLALNILALLTLRYLQRNLPEIA